MQTFKKIFGFKNQLTLFQHKVEIKDKEVKADTKQINLSYSKPHIDFDDINEKNNQGLSVVDNHIRSPLILKVEVSFEVNEDTLYSCISP